MLVMSSSNCFNAGSDEDLFSDESIPLRNAPITDFSDENYAFNSFNPDSPQLHTKATNSVKASVPESSSSTELLNSTQVNEDDHDFKNGSSSERGGDNSETAEVVVDTAQNQPQKPIPTNHDSNATATKVLPSRPIRPILRTGLSQPILQLSSDSNTIDDSFPFLGSVRKSVPSPRDNYVQKPNRHAHSNQDHEHDHGFERCKHGQAAALNDDLNGTNVKFSSDRSLSTIESGHAYNPYEQQRQHPLHTASFRISPSSSGKLSRRHSYLANRSSHPALPTSISNPTCSDYPLQASTGFYRESSMPPLTTISTSNHHTYNVPTAAAVGSGVLQSMNRPLNAADLRSMPSACFTAEQMPPPPPSSHYSPMTAEGDIGFGAANMASGDNRIIHPTAFPCSTSQQPARLPRIKSLIDRQLRKFSSETSFATTPDTGSDSSEHELTGGATVSTGARGRVFTVRAVPNNPFNRTNHTHRSASGGGANTCGSATVFSRLLRKRHESDESAISMGSEATLASGSMTPLSKRRVRSSTMKRPKSAIQMMASGHGSSDFYGTGTYGGSQASATIHSLHSLDSVQPLTINKEEQRRTSNVYMMDDDSTHEFEEDSDEFENVTLMYAKHEKIPMKDFGSEIRATMDIDHLLNKSVLLLDLQETSLEEIFAKIIHEMDIQEPEFTSEQVRSVLFTQDAGNQFHILSRTVQSICTTGTIGGSFDYDQTWICALCMLNTVQHRHVAIARLSHPTNLGRTMQDLRFIIIVIAPSRAKGTKTALETTRTFATLFADMDIRQRLVMAQTVDQFRSTLLQAAKELAVDQNQWRERKTSIHLSQAKEQLFGPGRWYPFRGLKEDFCRRIQFYASDYLDGIRGPKTIQKLFSSIVFLYFACLLPAIAFGVLNDDNTNGGINVRKVIFAQAIGGIFFAIFGGQPVIILLTTVPLAIYIKVIYKISQELGYDFFAMYACVGLWCQFFLIVYASTEMCSLMKLATRSAEEMFSLFIAIAFTFESIRAIHTSFKNNYHNCDEDPRRRKNADETSIGLRLNASTFTSIVDNITGASDKIQTTFGKPCHRDTSILYMLLMFGTLWLGLFLYNFRKTPYLTRSRREWLADYALPASVLIMSFTGAYCFSDIEKDKFKMRDEMALLAVADIFSLPWQGYFVCALLGFSLSFLFFMDQNITSAIVNNPQNKLRKGSAQNLDLFVVAILNCFLSIMGLPWIHGALPHSPLHLRALADVEERLLQGHVHEVIMNVRETRLATLIAHTLILISTYTLLPYPLRWIPTSVLHGLFLYMALTSLAGNEMFERLLLLITEQQAYPPTHYIRKVPQRKVHLFTACQLIQLILLCAFGFSPYPFIEMVFPIVCFFFLPIRHTLIPRLIDYKYLDALDGRH